MKKSVAIIGGGLTGVVLAGRLAEKESFSVELFEKSSCLGGLHKSVTFKNMVFDIGPFVFPDPYIFLEVFPSVNRFFIPFQPELSVITPNNKFDKYPMSIKGYLKHNGYLVFLRSVIDLIVARFKYWKRSDVSSFARYYTGDLIYELSGLKYYIQRFYGLPDTEIDLQFASQRLRGIKDFTPYNYILYLWKRLFGLTKRDLNLSIIRSAEGFTAIYDHIYNVLRERNVNLTMNANIQSVQKDKNKFVLSVNNTVKHFDYVISTIPISDMVRLIGADTTISFSCIHLYSIFYVGKISSSSCVIFNHTSHGRWKRITVFSRFYGQIDGRDYFTVEITTEKTDIETQKTLRQEFEKHAHEIELFPVAPEYLGSLITKNAYPLYRKGIDKNLEEARHTLSSNGIRHIGRQGNFEYLFSGNASFKAKELADTLQ